MKSGGKVKKTRDSKLANCLSNKFKDPLTQQADEGLRISKQTKSTTILNSKSEFNHPPIGRIKIAK